MLAGLVGDRGGRRLARHPVPSTARSRCPTRSTTWSSDGSPDSPTTPGDCSSLPPSSAGRSTPTCSTSIEPIGEAEALAAVEALLVAQVLEEGRDGHFRFAHDKLREVAYEQIPLPRREALHRTVALAIESRTESPDERSRHSATLCPPLVSLDRRPQRRARGGRPGDRISRNARSGMPSTRAFRPRPSNSAGPPRACWGSNCPSRRPRSTSPWLGNCQGIERVPRQPIHRRPPRSPRLGRPGGRPDRRAVAGIQPPAFLSNQLSLFALMASKSLGLDPRTRAWPPGGLGLRDGRPGQADHPRRRPGVRSSSPSWPSNSIAERASFRRRRSSSSRDGSSTTGSRPIREILPEFDRGARAG